jgi:hypothetical protein
MSKKAKKESKRERRAREMADREVAERIARQRLRRWRWVAIIIPVLTVAAALVTWGVTDNTQLAALIGLLGVGLWVPALLGLIGASVAPRDRTRAGSIDFGNRS